MPEGGAAKLETATLEGVLVTKPNNRQPGVAGGRRQARQQRLQHGSQRVFSFSSQNARRLARARRDRRTNYTPVFSEGRDLCLPANGRHFHAELWSLVT